MGEYSGRVVVVTGGGSGLGAAMADIFAAEGAKLALLDIDGERAEQKAAELRAQGAEVLARRVDVGDAASIAAAADEVQSRLGGCDVLCANVGVQQFGAIGKLTPQDWSWVMSVNVLGVIHTVDAFLPMLRAGQGERHVVLTASSSYFSNGVRLGAYVTSKYAVVGFGEVLRKELENEGINVALLFPGGMESRHLESSVKARPKELGDSVLDQSDIEAMMASADMTVENHVVSPDYAVRNLLADLRDKHAYIITHGNYRHLIEARQRQETEAFDRMKANA